MTKRIFIIAVLLTIVGVFVQTGSLAQQYRSSSASLSGLVFSADSKPLSDVVVRLEAKDQKVVRSISDTNGAFKMELPAGNYFMVVYRSGYVEACEEIVLMPAAEVQRRFTLAAGECVDCCLGNAPEELATTDQGPVGELVLKAPLQSAPNIAVNGYTATDKVQRGRLVQMAVVMDIPHGYHVNSNRPLESFLKATQLSVETTSGVRAGAVIYPRASLRKFAFSKTNLSVYEGRVILRFNVTVPANFRDGNLEVKAKLNYQSCSDALCFPPQYREVRVGLPVASANESVKRINGEIFGKR